MAQFTDFMNILPDPNNSIGWAGQSTTSSSEGAAAGPGFASVSLTSQQPTIRNVTNSGRILGRAIAAHKWKIKITYNPMTRAEFDPVYTFLLQRRGPLNPFFVSLPQYRVPKDSTFATYAASNNLEVASGAGTGAGNTSLTITQTGSVSPPITAYSISTHSHPKPGDLFTFNATNSNHKKAYMVTKVQTPTDYQGSSAPASNHLVIDFIPSLSKAVVSGDDLIFHNPLVKVIMVGDVQEYSLNTQNLYSFSLNLEEVQ